MVNEKIQESIELLSTNPLTQFNVDKAADILSEVLEEYKSLSPSSLKAEYNNQYNIHKNDNVVAKDLPYINREFYKHTFLPNEDVLIGFYVDTEKETYYRDDINDIYKLMMYDNHKLIKTVYINSGSQQMNFGKLSEGEHVLAYEVQDIYGRKSFRDFFEIRVKSSTTKLAYTVTDDDLLKYSIDKTGVDFENTATGFNQMILDLDATYNYLIIPTGTYQIKYGETIVMKDNLTLDLNGSEITLQPCQAGDKNTQVAIQQCYDSHIINGAIVGDRLTHDYTNSPNASEWVHGISLSGRSKYSSYENVEVRDVTGYGSISGMASDRNQGFYGYLWLLQDFAKKYNSTSRRTESSDFIDVNNFKKEGCGFFQTGLYLGYQGMPSSTWYYRVEFYNENKVLVDDFNAYYYRRVYIPDDVRYCKIYSIEGTSMSGSTQIFAFKIPVNCELKNVRYVDCRCVGCSVEAMESFRLIDCYFTRCGSNSAKCAFDAEDGWDMMHDFYMSGTVFENNYQNDWLTCAGHNFILENNEYNGSMFFWTRCQNYTVRNNKIKNIQEGYNKPSHHIRIYNNECSNDITATNGLIKDCIAAGINGNAKNCKLTKLYSAFGEKRNCSYALDNSLEYIKDCKIYDSIMQLKDGITTRQFSFNQKDADRVFQNCEFRGGKYNLTNHNCFNNGEFINCKFDSIYITVGVQSTETQKNLHFKDCILPINGTLLKIGPFAYSIGKVDVVFENCIITDLGNYKLDGYGYGNDLITAFSVASPGVITFKNCTITKTDGMLLRGNRNGSLKLDIIFENTILSDNLLEIQDSLKDYVNIIIK